jgi:hypothetical protein
MEWLLIAWVGMTLIGEPALERFATEAECKKAAETLAVVAGLRPESSEMFRWRCVQAAPLPKS